MYPLFLFYREGDWGKEKLNNLFMVSKLGQAKVTCALTQVDTEDENRKSQGDSQTTGEQKGSFVRRAGVRESVQCVETRAC